MFLTTHIKHFRKFDDLKPQFFKKSVESLVFSCTVSRYFSPKFHQRPLHPRYLYLHHLVATVVFLSNQRCRPQHLSFTVWTTSCSCLFFKVFYFKDDALGPRELNSISAEVVFFKINSINFVLSDIHLCTLFYSVQKETGAVERLRTEYVKHDNDERCY